MAVLTWHAMGRWWHSVRATAGWGGIAATHHLAVSGVARGDGFGDRSWGLGATGAWKNWGLFRCAMASVSSLGWVDSFRNEYCGGVLLTGEKQDNFSPGRLRGLMKRAPPGLSANITILRTSLRACELRRRSTTAMRPWWNAIH